jgi:hypothetical protein
MKFKRYLLTLFFAAFILNASFAVNDTIILNSDIHIEKISTDLDSIVSSWYIKMALRNQPEYFAND